MSYVFSYSCTVIGTYLYVDTYLWPCTVSYPIFVAKFCGARARVCDKSGRATSEHNSRNTILNVCRPCAQLSSACCLRLFILSAQLLSIWSFPRSPLPSPSPPRPSNHVHPTKGLKILIPHTPALVFSLAPKVPALPPFCPQWNHLTSWWWHRTPLWSWQLCSVSVASSEKSQRRRSKQDGGTEPWN